MAILNERIGDRRIAKKLILFSNNNEALAVFSRADTKAEEIVAVLDIPPPKALILIAGGADTLDEKHKLPLVRLFGGIARAAANLDAVIIDGGTQSGVMELMGQGIADCGYQSPLIGVAPIGKVKYPGSIGEGDTDLDPNHSYFVLVEGGDWGSELDTINKLVQVFTKESAGVVILAGGGPNSINEALCAVRYNLPLIVLEGTGGMADEIAVAWRSMRRPPQDPGIAAIVASEYTEIHPAANSTEGLEILITRKLTGA